MADATLTEAVKKQKAADALSEEDTVDSADDAQTSSESTDETTDTAAEPQAPAAVSEEDVDVSPAAQMEASSGLGYRFVPVTPAPVAQAPATRPAQPLEPEYVGIGEGQPAPDTLAQVERGELVKPPIQPASDQLTQVERAQPAGQPALDQLPQVERGELVNVPPGTAPRALPIPTELPAVTVTAQAPPAQETKSEARPGYTFVPVAPPAQPAVQPTQPVPPVVAGTGIKPLTADETQEPGIDIQSNGYSSGRGNQAIRNVVLHSTDGHEKGDINRLTQSGEVGVQYYVTKDGRVMHFVNDADSAWQAGKDKYGNNANPYTIGIEQEHVDGKEAWPDAQVRATARTAAGILLRNPSLTLADVVGHSDIAPERKQDPVGYPWEHFRAYVAAYMGQGAPVKPEAPQAQPATKQANGFYQNEKPQDFLTGKATTFATPQDIASGQDNGIGAPRLGRLDTTQVAGMAIPEEALRAKYGNNYAAWRTARVDVVDPQSGKRLRVPIVDLGPRGDLSAIADMTPALSRYFGGDKNLSVKLVDNAGPDVTKNPALFADEQAAIRQGVDSSALAPGAARVHPPQGYNFKAVMSAADTAKAQIGWQQDTITKLPESGSGNIIGLYKRLDQPVEGVTDQIRQQTQANLKPQIISLIQQKFPELNAADAWTKAQSDVGALDVGREWITKAIGYGQQFTNVLQKGVAGTDQLHVNQFLDAAIPGASDADKHAYLAKLYAMPVDQRIAEISAKLPQPQAGIPSTDPQQIVSALDRLSDPNFQKQQAADLAKAKAEMQRNISDDPRLKGTVMERVVDATAQMPSFIAAMSNPVLWPAAMAQVSDQVREGFRQEHPKWDEKTLEQNTARATLVQFFGQAAAGALWARGVGAVFSTIDSPAKRAIATTIAGLGGAPVITGATQAGVNIVTGQPIGKGVGEAAITGAIQGVIPGIVHGVGELGRPRGAEPVRPPVTEERPPVTEPERPPAAVPPAPVTEAPRYLSPEQEFPSPEAQLAELQRRRAGELPEPAVPSAPVTPPVGESEPWVSAIANKYVQPRVEPGEIPPTKGYSTQELIDRGLLMTPEEINQHVSDVMNGKDVVTQGAALRAQEAQLSQRSAELSKAAEADPSNAQAKLDAQNAEKDWLDFHNGPIAKLKNIFHGVGQGLQKEVPVDLSTFNGLRQKWFQDLENVPKAKDPVTGEVREPSKDMDQTMRRVAKAVKGAEDDLNGSMGKFTEAINNVKAKRSIEETKNRIMEALKTQPCIPS